ncbi:sigma-54-dependent Fis family transcriptional regulator [Agrobacterium leguminum]|uniref:sigma-54-dependent Fis family transcriptional regulator n=1 Tax=Agrobacterium TaxID=357 RepID=UPI001572DEB9|nr:MULTISPECIES: sigma-54-dependent Fis family transcriptional regulator [Agrobacterium]MCZ7934846.1 sigma-54-dependent Fis family transcriptional regulator [Agrobacterium leguminum]NSX94139.1 sigma-54-dependent Fis family transcriptional regulator [Agrobacterium tumefaciens]NTA35483.1 sigma-54-dependent Fis family transcriptional regulator [Agrobacterium salinitolerans]
MLGPDDHFRVIEQAVLTTAGRGEWRTASWARCLQDYKLDPSRPKLVDLTNRELREEQDTFDADVALATNELEATLMMIEGGGYSAHIANRNGVIISERRSRDAAFYCSTDRIGAVWSEEVGGTNGIGTALKNLEPTAVYLSDHFYADLTGQACATAPFFGPDGNILGVVNLSTYNPGVPQLAHRVVFGVAQITADRLETTYFRNAFRKYYTLAVSTEQRSPTIFAVDSDCRIVGATRNARRLFKLEESAIGTRTLWAVFEKIKGNPPLDYLCDNLRELRPLGSGKVIDVNLRRPLSVLPASITSLAAGAATKIAKPKLGKKITSLAECAGNDRNMKRNIDVLRKVFGSGLHMLLLGETGVGKDTLTRALHYESERATGPFVAFNCSAVPETLIDSELFGYSGGAFTGASKEGNVGRIVEADKGTLFLDEIGDMPLPLQTRLLRFLETQEVMPLGSGRARTVDVQVVAATHQDLNSKVAAGTFRQDLFYRLAGTIVTLPALRDREDLETIIGNLMEQFSEDVEISLSDRAMKILLAHSWPGNIRELRNVLTRAAKLATRGLIEPNDLMLVPIPVSAVPAPSPIPTAVTSSGEVREVRVRRPTSPLAGRKRQMTPYKAAAVEAEKVALVTAMERFGRDPVACMEALGISRATFYRKLKQHGLALGEHEDP